MPWIYNHRALPRGAVEESASATGCALVVNMQATLPTDGRESPRPTATYDTNASSAQTVWGKGAAVGFVERPTQPARHSCAEIVNSIIARGPVSPSVLPGPALPPELSHSAASSVAQLALTLRPLGCGVLRGTSAWTRGYESISSESISSSASHQWSPSCSGSRRQCTPPNLRRPDGKYRASHQLSEPATGTPISRWCLMDGVIRSPLEALVQYSKRGV